MKIIDPSSKEFECLHNDAHLLFNLLDQKKRGFKKKTDFIQPGILSGQSLESVLREIVGSITNHLDNFEKDDVML